MTTGTVERFQQPIVADAGKMPVVFNLLSIENPWSVSSF
jgi:hypothetical protein